jgi:G3E family GTPase
MTTPSRIPVIILTGFLGSGKTTLLNRLLADGIKTGVIINEFGSTPVDQDLLLDQSIPMTVLSGGCLCCQIKGALTPTLKNLWMAWNGAPEKPFDRLIIETSGVASPEPILDTLLREPWIARRYALQLVVATLAIPSARGQLDRHAEARAQVAWADTLLLTHADCVDVSQIAELSAYLKTLAPTTPTLMAALDSFNVAALLDSGRPPMRRLPNSAPLPDHNFRSLSLYLEHKPNLPHLQSVLQKLLDRHPDASIRIKGIVYSPEHTEAWAIHAAEGRLYPPVSLPERVNQDRRSRLILIALSDLELLAQELSINLGSGLLDPNAIRLH